MVKKLEVELMGHTFIADLLEEDAPRICKAILSILPYEGPVWHQSMSGPSLMSKHPRLNKMVDDHGINLSTSFRPYDDNVNVIGSLGELALYPIGTSIFITYGKANFRGGLGFEPAYPFARISKDLDKLVEVGRAFRSEDHPGVQKIKISLKN